MKVRWTSTAQRHLVAIHEYIARDSPRYATHMVDRITGRTKQIGRFPQSGQKVSEYHDDAIREVLEGSYRVIYEIADKEIQVLAIIHGARLLPPEPPQLENM